MPDSGKRQSFDLMQASDLGLRLAIFAALPIYGGYELDQWMDSSPLYLLSGAALGIGGGMWSVVKSVNRITGSREQPSGRPSDESSEEFDDDR